jgi:hypothetical protein
MRLITACEDHAVAMGKSRAMRATLVTSDEVCGLARI